MKALVKLVGIVVFLWVLFGVRVGFCGLDLVISNVSGGIVLDDSDNYTADLKVRVVNSEGQAYEIKQFLSQPLISEDGKEVADNLLSCWLSFNSVMAGSVQWQREDRLSLYPKTVYLSDKQGDEVVLNFTYKLDDPEVLSAGVYHTQIVLVLKSEKNYIRRVIPVTINIGNKTTLLLLETSSKGKELYLHSGSVGYLRVISKEPIFQITKEGNLEGLQIKVVKDSVTLLPWRELDEPVVVKGDGELIVFCKLVSALLPGEYKGRIVFNNLSGQVLLSVDVLGEVEKEFNLRINKFLIDLLPQNDKSVNQLNYLELEIRNNTGHGYVFLQDPVTNNFLSGGKSFPVEWLQVRVERFSSDNNSWVEIMPWSPVKAGQMPLYISDSKGKPVKLRLFYRLDPSKVKKVFAGDYQLNVGFSLIMK